MKYTIPTIAALAESATTEAVEAFWSRVAHDRTPLIEPTDHPGVSLVTWLYREGDRPIARIMLVEPCS